MMPMTLIRGFTAAVGLALAGCSTVEINAPCSDGGGIMVAGTGAWHMSERPGCHAKTAATQQAGSNDPLTAAAGMAALERLSPELAKANQHVRDTFVNQGKVGEYTAHKDKDGNWVLIGPPVTKIELAVPEVPTKPTQPPTPAPAGPQ